MPQETVTLVPKFINPPKEGKRYASLNVDGVYYSFDPAKIPLSSFTKGRPSTVEVKVTAEGYNNIVRLVEAPQGSPAAAQQAQANGRADARDELITRTAVAKSVLEGLGMWNQDAAEAALAWIEKRSVAKPKAASAELDDDIPF